MIHRELLVGGHLIGGVCDQAIGKEQVYSPYHGKLVGTVAEGGWPEMDAALDAANMAFKTWRHSAARQRQDLLRLISKGVRERFEELVDLLIEEVGKPRIFAEGEVNRLALTFDLAADYCTAPQGHTLPVDYDPRGDGYRAEVRRVPIGVVFCVVPYNWPLNLAAHKIAPALACGCTLVVKAPVIGALTTLTLAQIIKEAGCPDGVLNVLHCANDIAQKAIEDNRTTMLSFTGSGKVGWMLKGLVPTKPVTLELGGDAFAVVFPDADLDYVVSKIVPGGYGYAGQVCISVQHVLCHAQVYDAFRAKLIAATDACPTGDPALKETVCGPLINDDHAEKVMAMVASAEEAGASVIAGGNRVGRVVHPTLVENVPYSTPLGHEEVFGPVMTLTSFDSTKEAIGRVNQSVFGIQCGVFTYDIRIAEQFAREAETGSVIIGDSPSLRFDSMPYGGDKQSGTGREGIASAVQSMTVEKTVVTRTV
ncbi:MAG: aldehyde dehydrogenase family protein [Armatimonadota bacterium]